MIYVLKQNVRNPMTRGEEMIEVYNFAEACHKMGRAVEQGADYAELWKDGKLVAHAHPKGFLVVATANDKAQ